MGISAPNLKENTKTSVEDHLDHKIRVLSEKYGVKHTLAKKIIWCESKNKPNAVRLNKLKNGAVWSTDIGYWQLNDYYWEEKMAKLGWNIRIPNENLEAGFWILQKYDTSPWFLSEDCWGK